MDGAVRRGVGWLPATGDLLVVLYKPKRGRMLMQTLPNVLDVACASLLIASRSALFLLEDVIKTLKAHIHHWYLGAIPRPQKPQQY